MLLICYKFTNKWIFASFCIRNWRISLIKLKYNAISQYYQCDWFEYCIVLCMYTCLVWFFISPTITSWKRGKIYGNNFNFHRRVSYKLHWIDTRHITISFISARFFLWMIGVTMHILCCRIIPARNIVGSFKSFCQFHRKIFFKYFFHFYSINWNCCFCYANKSVR